MLYYRWPPVLSKNEIIVWLAFHELLQHTVGLSSKILSLYIKTGSLMIKCVNALKECVFALDGFLLLIDKACNGMNRRNSRIIFPIQTHKPTDSEIMQKRSIPSLLKWPSTTRCCWKLCKILHNMTLHGGTIATELLLNLRHRSAKNTHMLERIKLLLCILKVYSLLLLSS